MEYDMFFNSFFKLTIIITLSFFFFLFSKIKFDSLPRSKFSTFIFLAENIYICGFVVLQFFCGVIHQIIFKNEYEFLPLLVTSVYCALGIIYSWFRFTLIYFLGTGEIWLFLFSIDVISIFRLQIMNTCTSISEKIYF